MASGVKLTRSGAVRFFSFKALVAVGVLSLTVMGAVARVAWAYSDSGIQGYAAEVALESGTIVQSDDTDASGDSGSGVDAVAGNDADAGASGGDSGDNENDGNTGAPAQGQVRKVKAASQDEVHKMFGVVVDSSRLSVTLSTGLENEAYVATTGTHNVLVSTQGGAIAAGDYLMLSAIKGVATKADTQEVTVFGRAAAPFDGKGITLGSTAIKDVDGKVTDTVVLGSIPVTIDIRQNPNTKSTKTKAPEFLERIGEAIAEKEVDPIRIYISMGIASVSLITALIVIYAGVRNGMISIGRNPMSKKSIFRALFEIILTSALILIIGLFAVYLLLKL